LWVLAGGLSAVACGSSDTPKATASSDITVHDDCATPTDWWPDRDGDGFGATASDPVQSCGPPAGADHGWVEDASDCDDRNATVHPEAPERCGPEDDDCDGVLDEDDPDWDPSSGAVFYVDADGDGYGGASTTHACELRANLSTSGGDCDDAHYYRNPGQQEVCSGADEDCDGLIDDDDPDIDVSGEARRWPDLDGDRQGDADSPPERRCDSWWEAHGPAVTNDDDCDDSNPAIRAGAPEVCGNGIDDDCDALVDCEDAACPDTCVELHCDDSLDDDADGLADCSDDDCWGRQPCGTTRVRIDSAQLRFTFDSFATFYTSQHIFGVTSATGTITRTLSGTTVSQCGWRVPSAEFNAVYFDSGWATTTFRSTSSRRAGVSMSSSCAHIPGFSFLPAGMAAFRTSPRWFWSPRGSGTGVGPGSVDWYPASWTYSWEGPLWPEYGLEGFLASPQSVTFSF